MARVQNDFALPWADFAVGESAIAGSEPAGVAGQWPFAVVHTDLGWSDVSLQIFGVVVVVVYSADQSAAVAVAF
jgi:hypothetical protein